MPQRCRSRISDEGGHPHHEEAYLSRMPVNDFQPQSISAAELGGRVIFAVDIAKVDMVAAFAAADGHVLQTICWKAPTENYTVLGILRGFRAAGLEVETRSAAS